MQMNVIVYPTTLLMKEHGEQVLFSLAISLTKKVMSIYSMIITSTIIER